jgi:hypothetical protein
MSFFQSLAQSKFIDSYSLYTLELFPGSLRYYKEKSNCAPLFKGAVDSDLSEETEDFYSTDQDDIYEEFATLKDILLDA